MQRLVRVNVTFSLLISISLLFACLFSPSININSDMNLDGRVDICDLSLLQSIILGKTEGLYVSDLNGDGKLDITDLQTLLNEIGKKPGKSGDNRTFSLATLISLANISAKKEANANSHIHFFEENIYSLTSHNSRLVVLSKEPTHKSKLFLELGFMINAPPREV